MTLKPLLLAITGVSAVSGVGVGVVYAFKPNSPTPISIRKQIQNSKKKILSDSANTWNIKLNTYKSKFKDTIPLTKQDEESLKKWCTNTLNSDFKNESDSNYLNSKQLCTVPTIEEKLLSESKTLADEKDWENKANSYNSTAEGNNLINEINKKSASKEDMEAWCKKIFQEELPEKGNAYIAAKKWCTKEG